ncbi:hypothetical protein BKA93DRAFT_745105 [Sparassis latifolia]
MTLPANDAFSLAAPHDSARPTIPLAFQSASPKIPFVSSPRSRSALSPKPRRRSMTVGEPSLDVKARAHPRASSGYAKPNGGDSAPRLRRKRGRTPSPEAVPVTKLKEKAPIDWEIPRKTLHSSIGFLTLYLYSSGKSPRIVVYALGLALPVIILGDVLRLRSPRFEAGYERFLGFLMRESEKRTTNGVIWYIIGVMFVLCVYPLDIAVVSILILSWADTAASTFGRLFGAYTPPLPRALPLLNIPLARRKSLAGFIAGSLTGALIAIGVWGWFAPVRRVDFGWPPNAPELRKWVGLGIVGLVSGLVSGIAEALDLGSWDDNLTLPIISGGCIWGFFKLLEHFTA